MLEPRVMILTAGYGEGHNQVSKALEQELAARGIRDVWIVDLMKEAHPWLNSVSTKFYLKNSLTSQYGLDFYGWSYYLTRETRPGSSLGKYFNLLGKKKLKSLLHQASPDLLLNTFPFGAAAETGNELGIPVCTVITDYSLHGRWVHPEMSRYYVATEHLKNEMVSKNYSRPQQVIVTGIPVRKGFTKVQIEGRDVLRKDQSQTFGSHKKLVLISSGSFGVLQHLEEVTRLLLQEGSCRVAVICGRNKRMQEKWQDLFGAHPDVDLYGFVPHIHEIMAQADCLITKAGGVTLSEAIALHVPLFIYKPFSGQERENALFLAGIGAARIADTASELSRQIAGFLANPAEQASMHMRMASLNKGVAAGLIVDDLLELMRENMRVTV